MDEKRIAVHAPEARRQKTDTIRYRLAEDQMPGRWWPIIILIAGCSFRLQDVDVVDALILILVMHAERRMGRGPVSLAGVQRT
eukprot:3651334-Prymnesium_polylepis.2